MNLAPIRVVIEIMVGASGDLPSELLISTYRASRWGPIILVLNGVCPHDVDRILDPVVASLPLDIPGLIYVESFAAAKVLTDLRGVEAMHEVDGFGADHEQPCAGTLGEWQLS